jgi:hypothetical protein
VVVRARKNFFVSNIRVAGNWWLKFVILATWEVEIERTEVRGQSTQANSS